MTTTLPLSISSTRATLEGDDVVARLRSIAETHPAFVNFRKTWPNAEEHRHVLNFQPEHVADNLTASTLCGTDLITAGPYLLADDASGSVLVLYHLGKRLSGHAGLVHGGIAPVLLDEVMGRACFPRFATKIGVTASLEVKYKNPIPVGSVVMMRAHVRELSGRKAWVDAVVEDAENEKQIKVEASALYIEPKWAASMSKVL